jgi:hypothetical protein
MTDVLTPDPNGRRERRAGIASAFENRHIGRERLQWALSSRLGSPGTLSGRFLAREIYGWESKDSNLNIRSQSAAFYR